MCVGMGHVGARTEIHMVFWQENLEEKIYDMIFFYTWVRAS